MSNTYLTPVLTNAGRALLVKAIAGEKITFTKIVLGSGTDAGEDPSALTSPKLLLSITEVTKDEGYAVVTGSGSSSQLAEGFYATELGVFAKGADNQEILYAYRYTEDATDYYPATASDMVLTLAMSVVIMVGSAQNVSVELDHPSIGSYTGDGTVGRVISLGFAPRAVLLTDDLGNTFDSTIGTAGGLAVQGHGVRASNGTAADADTWDDDYTVLMLTNAGFKVNYNATNKVLSNVSGTVYRYVAFK